MKKYRTKIITFIIIIFIILYAPLFAQNQAPANNQSQVQEQQDQQKINVILETFDIITDEDVHLKALIESYFKSGHVNPAVLSGELISAFAGINPQKVSPPKKTIFNSVLNRLLDEAIANQSSIATKSLEPTFAHLMQQENDVLILTKIVTLYGTIAQGQDEEKQYFFARNALYMMRRLQSKTDKYTLATLIETAAPLIANVMNKKISTDQEMMGIILYLYSMTVVPNAESALETLYARAVNVAFS